MFANYVKLALRNMAKNRLYAFINVAGLAIGLAVFLFGMVLATYERDHDSMFANRDQIYTAGSVFADGADIGVLETNSVYTALGPLLATELGDLNSVARTVTREFLVTVGDSNDSYYHTVTFADPTLTEIFDFDYLYGDGSVMADPRAVILSESSAQKYFGRSDVVGEVLTLDHEHDLVVKAVIADIAADSHFNSSLIQQRDPRMFIQLDTLGQINDFKFDEDWGNLSMGDMTYMLMTEGKSRQWLSDQVNAVFQRHAPEGIQEFIPLVRVRPLVEANTQIWDAIGIPAITTIQLLGLLVLIVACVNYTNLATAQSLGRAREVGLRKTFGAGQGQLLAQFLVESLTIATLSMLLALACLELLVPAFNQWSSKSLSLEYLSIAPFLVFTTLFVGIAAGAYPAYMITRANPIDSLQNSMLKGNRGGLFRSLMIGVQFTISVFMLACVLVMFFQNQQVAKSANIFPKDNIVVLERAGVEDIVKRHQTLRRQLMALPGVENVTYTSQVPFDQSNSSLGVAPTPGDEAAEISMNQVRIDEGFLETYDIPLLAGRTVTRDIAGDFLEEDGEMVNVLINELAARSLGFESPESAVGESYWQILSERSREEGRTATQYNVVGLVPDQNFLGLHNKIKPMMFVMENDWIRAASVRVKSENMLQTLQDIERVWEEVIPDYPIQQRFLDDVFNDVYVIFKTMNSVLAGFAMVALSLALIGLFGLAAFMAERRTREIGIRKVLGARVDQIVRLLVWQFSIPVLWSLLLAMPLAYAASGLYLNFFDERITMLPLIIGLAAVMGLVTAWLIVSVHAVKIAASSPIQSLRYE
ncbi:MAG: FtsX-like permease family protein [Halieaceae bacterium]|jgi:putative ABC transport system permease protein|nr:FtsX-like permease family protein [Halieaceae bacterium]